MAHSRRFPSSSDTSWQDNRGYPTAQIYSCLCSLLADALDFFLIDIEYQPTMQYPHPAEFPQTSRARVSAESIRAARDFEEAKQVAHDRSAIENLLRNYILRVFIEYVREARHLGRKGLWTVDQPGVRIARIPPPVHDPGLA